VTRRLRLVGGLMRHPGAPWRRAHLLSSARSGPRAAATVVGGERRAAEAAARAEPRPGAADITRQWRDAHRSMCEAADGPSSARAGCSAVMGERHGACVVAAVLASATRDGWTGWRDREGRCRVDDDEKEAINHIRKRGVSALCVADRLLQENKHLRRLLPVLCRTRPMRCALSAQSSVAALWCASARPQNHAHTYFFL